MSAWFLSKAHIDALVTYAVAHGITVPGAPDTPQAIGLMLWEENKRSMDHRYSHYPEEFAERAEAVAGYLYSPATLAQNDGFGYATLAGCYGYQACEHPGWGASVAKALSDAVEAHALASVGLTHYDEMSGHPGAESAVWGVEEKDVVRAAETV